MPRTAPPTPLRLHVLGPFRVESATGPLLLPARKDQSLLAYLVLHPQPSGHTREKLATLLWGDSPEAQARGSLRTALKNLRQHLGMYLVLADRETVKINPAFPLWVDARDFEAHVSSAPQSAVALYRGELLADLYDDWILPEREHYRELYLNALLQLTQAARAASEYERAIEYAHKALAADPANERAHQHLMFCNLALGDRRAALKQYDTCVRALQTELAVEPARETTALYQWIKQARSERASLAAQITNLPIPLSSFIGRKKEVTQLKERITVTRLLTLSGAGGSGKTRLAIQVATDLIDQLQDGVWWVDLAPLMDEALVPHAVAQALGVREAPNQTLTETLTTFLRHKQLLLVLDNCEHLLAACAQLADDLLSHCANLRILATSREALGITGEMVYHVPTLSLPQPQRLTLTDLLLGYEGICLFVERACAVKSDFALTEQNAAAVLHICQRLDGLPLALELAAARTKMLTAEQIAERLNDRFNLLTQGSRTVLPRQQTLYATIDWSYDLLPDEARLLFRRLSVFAGGFTLEAAEGVCAEEPLAPRTLFDLLARLVDRSLVKVERQGEYALYGMLETIREYAREKLDGSGETERVRQHHRDFFIAFAEQAARRVNSGEQMEWLDRLEIEHDNVRAAWDCAIESDAELGLRLAWALLGFWIVRGNPSEGREWLAKLVERTKPWGRTAKRAHVLGLAGRLAYSQSDFAAARPLLEEALPIARLSGDKLIIAFVLLWLGRTAHRQGDVRAAQSFTEESLMMYQGLQNQRGIAQAMLHLAGLVADQGHYAEAEERCIRSLATFQALGDKFMAGHVCNWLGEMARLQGDYARAGKSYEQSIEIFQEQHSRVYLATPLFNLGWVSLRGGDDRKARTLFEESLKLYSEYGDKNGMADNLLGLASVLGMIGRPEQAAQLFGAAESLRESIGGCIEPSDQKEFDHYAAAVRAQLDEAAFAKAWAEGRAMTLEQVIEHALVNIEVSV
jgi:predicted ATPase/DNA-binding SARP family transcriptional activator